MRRRAGGDVSLLPTASCNFKGVVGREAKQKRRTEKNVIVQLAVVVNKSTLSRSVETNDERT